MNNLEQALNIVDHAKNAPKVKMENIKNCSREAYFTPLVYIAQQIEENSSWSDFASGKDIANFFLVPTAVPASMRNRDIYDRLVDMANTEKLTGDLELLRIYYTSDSIKYDIIGHYPDGTSYKVTTKDTIEQAESCIDRLTVPFCDERYTIEVTK